ncbi:uncharacterized protein N7496_008959 [Penicillium cataractarum]|uniref:FAD/NAD(P)-binding domain-containing protein n=1 Tax=Penicillium cataractarum TaxID=2100454 RepID=A0A9W9S230_9EURO|nr:uncharacterized protein N7496_008959 [Penicillium cataractarum]KAJ5369199.1 hypothetical protein N7496_008959 [Penicillium cataractarum]
MDRVVIVGAGLYGLIAAKTYLQVAGAYDTPKQDDDTTQTTHALPNCFSNTRQNVEHTPGCSLLVIDAASGIGGTWAEKRLYPNLLSQNSYGMYEFSDLPLSHVVPEEATGVGQQFIAGWKINRYLHAWAEKWNLKRHIRLKWKVESICRLDSKEWELNVNIASSPPREIRVVCDRLILATGLTSVPNLPKTNSSSSMMNSKSVIHAKDVGDWARENLGYQTLPSTRAPAQSSHPNNDQSHPLKSVVIYGGAKSSFDLVHFFATLHRKDPALHLQLAPKDPVTVHWIIRKDGAGPAWMTPPTSSLLNGDTVGSDKVVSSRLLHYLVPCCYEIPKRLSGDLRMEGSWLVRLLHGNPLGRWWIRWFWRSVDRGLEDFAQYQSEPKMQLLRPSNSVVSCASGIGITNQPDLWETIRSSHVKVYRSSIEQISALNSHEENQPSSSVNIYLDDNICLEDVDLVIHATGYKPIVPINFDPPSYRLVLGMSGLIHKTTEKDSTVNQSEAGNGVEIPLDATVHRHIEHWKALDRQSDELVRKTLAATGCTPAERGTPSWIGDSQPLPYRLFRRMVAPELVADGDRSFASMGVVLTSTIAVVAEVQALWVAAFLTGGLDESSADCKSEEPPALGLDVLPQSVMEKAVSEDVVLGSLTGSGLEVDAIHVRRFLGLIINIRNES